MCSLFIIRIFMKISTENLVFHVNITIWLPLLVVKACVKFRDTEEKLSLKDFW